MKKYILLENTPFATQGAILTLSLGNLVTEEGHQYPANDFTLFILTKLNIIQESPHRDETQIDRLASFILTEFPEWPGNTGESEGAIDCVIRILKEYKKGLEGKE